MKFWKQFNVAYVKAHPALTRLLRRISLKAIETLCSRDRYPEDIKLFRQKAVVAQTTEEATYISASVLCSIYKRTGAGDSRSIAQPLVNGSKWPP
jgi:hypothetical protein